MTIAPTKKVIIMIIIIIATVAITMLIYTLFRTINVMNGATYRKNKVKEFIN